MADENLIASKRTFCPHCGKAVIVDEPFLAAFTVAHNVTPKVPERAFLSWARLSGKSIIPKFALDFYFEQYGGRIDFVTHQGVGAVLSDGVIREFVPTLYTNGDKAKINNVAIAREGSLSQVMAWTRTRNGYVAGRGAMFDALKKKTYGEFARPMIESGHSY